MTDNGIQPLRANRISLSAQTREYLLNLIENGTYEPGQQLPSENELAAQLGISRPTLREALLNLEQERAIIRRHGVGTFVAPRYGRLLDSGLERLESVLELAAQREMLVEVDDLEVSQRPASPDSADRLQVSPGTPLTCVDRVLVVDGTPVAYMSDVTLASVLSPPTWTVALAVLC
jgi:GntR family transcriptional regulator